MAFSLTHSHCSFNQCVASISALFLWGFNRFFCCCCCSLSILQGQGAITEKLRSLSMHDLTQINQQDDRGGNQLYHYSSHSANPAVRRTQSTDAAAEAGMCMSSQSQTNTDWGCSSPVLCPGVSCFRGTPILGTALFASVRLLLDIAPSDNNQHHFPFSQSH